MRVKLDFTLIIPEDGVQDYANEYHLERGEVRNDIKQQVKYYLQECLHQEITGWKVNEK